MPIESIFTHGVTFEFDHSTKFLMNHGTPSDRNIFKLHEPREFETPTPFSPLRIIRITHKASGVQFPAAKNVKPITASGIRNV